MCGLVVSHIHRTITPSCALLSSSVYLPQPPKLYKISFKANICCNVLKNKQQKIKVYPVTFLVVAEEGGVLLQCSTAHAHIDMHISVYLYSYTQYVYIYILVLAFIM